MNIFSKTALAVSMVLAVALPVASAQAAPVIATDVVTGGPGAYVHTFTLANNIGGANALYFFGVDLAGTITGTPVTWAGSGNQNANWTNSGYGGSSTVYPNTWCCSFGGTPSGSSSTGFQILSSVNPGTIKFFTYAQGGNDSNADGHFNASYNPGFEGIVGGGVAAVPEPALWLMMIGGFGVVGGAMRYRRRSEKVAFA